MSLLVAILHALRSSSPPPPGGNQPKGVGWSWIPQRFLAYNSCHAHYTKWYMLKGLLIRALTVCNNQSDFMKAVVYYTQGLISEGFPVSALRKPWRKFIYDKIPTQATKRTLTEECETVA